MVNSPLGIEMTYYLTLIIDKVEQIIRQGRFEGRSFMDCLVITREETT